MAIPFYAGIALGQIGRRLECRHGLCRPYEKKFFKRYTHWTIEIVKEGLHQIWASSAQSLKLSAEAMYRISSYSCRGNYSFLKSSSEETAL